MAIESRAVAGTYDRISFGHKNEVLMGYEYEIDNRKYDTYAGRSTAPLPSHFQGRFESLGGSMGFEIKSPVAPLQYHKLRAAILFQKLDFSTGTRNNGGIHVHVTRPDRRAIWPSHHRDLPPVDAKIFEFMHDRNIKDKFLFPISGRTRYSFDEYCGSSSWSAHYGIINYRTDNYEIRVFKAKTHLLIPALEFCDGLFSYAYSKDKPFDITVDGLIAYFHRHKKYSGICKVIRDSL